MFMSECQRKKGLRLIGGPEYEFDAIKLLTGGLFIFSFEEGNSESSDT